MISDEIVKAIYASLPADEKLKLALYSDFGEEAPTVYDFIKSPAKESEEVNVTVQPVCGLPSAGRYSGQQCRV